MKRVWLILSGLLLIATLSSLSWLVTSEAGLRWAYQQAQPYLPKGLSLTAIHGQLIGPITVKELRYQQNELRIESSQITLDWLPSALLAATFNINHLEITSLKISLPKQAEAEIANQAITLPEINLPWRVILMDALIDKLSIQQHQRHIEFHQLRLDASSLFNKININKFSLKAEHYNLTLSGELHPARNYHHKLTIDTQLMLAEQQPIHAHGTLQGDTQQSQLKQQLTGVLPLTLDLQLNDLLKQFHWQGTLQASQFESQKFNRTWPALEGNLKLHGNGNLQHATITGDLNGTAEKVGAFITDFSLQWQNDNTLHIDQLTLQSPLYDSQLNARGQWSPGDDGGKLAVALHWQNLRWPLNKQPWFNSAIGSAWLEGTLNHYQIALASERPLPQLPDSDWYTSATGNKQGIHFDSLRISTLGGEGQASGQLNWSPHLNWQAQLHADNLNPATIWPQWPGLLSGQLNTHGQYIANQLNANVDISQLQGELRGHPLTLRSKLIWQNDGLDITSVDLHSNDSHINISGRADQQLALIWSLESPELAQLHPQASGEFQAKGHIGGSPQKPLLEAHITGEQLQLFEYQMGRINGEIALDPIQWHQPNIQLNIEALRFQDHLLQSLSINAQNDKIELKAAQDNHNAQIELQGTVQEHIWRGKITKASINSQASKNWHLRQPSALAVSPQQITLEPLCLQHEQHISCMELSKKQNQWYGQLEAQHIPLSLLAPWLPNNLTLEGHTDIQAQLQHDNGQLSGKAELALSEGSINYTLIDDEPKHWPYQSGELNLDLTEQGIHGNSQLKFSNGDHFKARLSLPNAQLKTFNLSQQALQAEAQLTISNLELIEAISPEIQSLQGNVSLNITANGTLKQPQINGQAQLLNGSLRIPRLGITIKDLTLQSHSEALQKIHYTLKGRSADGNVSIIGQTTLDGSAGWPTELTIRGEEFEVSRIPEARILASPDLHITLKNHTAHINGSLHIPYAKLQPKDINSAAQISDDVVIIGEQQSTTERWLLYSRVRLTLGARVHLYGFGFEGRLGGNLLLEDEPSQLTRATGEISIPEGRYRAYGQRLDVEQGRLLYTGGLLSNPGLDLRCVRRINEVTAGLKVSGSLTQPQLELFTNPAMGQTDALAYLLLGRPIENASDDDGAMMSQAALALGLIGGDRLARSLSERFGLDEMRIESNDTGEQASLVMGRYLSPKLYLSYGVGLIEAFNTFNIRYQISDRWQLKGESGESQGADLLYTFER